MNTYPSLATHAPDDAACPALWDALRDVTDPEIPVSVVDMGLIVDLALVEGVAQVKLTFTAMGCPATEFILEDVRARLIRE
ncbi:MAG TPA: iron-sulfur cluster assembly protein, partial [Ktedonobacterales bacterium]|nr:iron-sulfur cluster assembly protein [Ktedonobacterales bacterium]